MIDLGPRAYGAHSLRRTKVALIYEKTGDLRACQLLLGHRKLESTVRYLGIEGDDAPEMSEQIDLERISPAAFDAAPEHGASPQNVVFLKPRQWRLMAPPSQKLIRIDGVGGQDCVQMADRPSNTQLKLGRRRY